MGSEQNDATRILLDHTGGKPRSADELMPLIYTRLKALAGSYMRNERASHTLQPTALVNEAFLRMIEIDRVDWQGKAHFFAVAARQMRRVLIDHARAHGARKRADHDLRVTFDEELGGDPSSSLVEMLALDEALERLAEEDERQARVAEMRLFSGMRVTEIATALNVSERTVKGDWRFARVWLMSRLRPASPLD